MFGGIGPGSIAGSFGFGLVGVVVVLFRFILYIDPPFPLDATRDPLINNPISLSP